jgi:NAD(P)-dependent dehydrogenase (short-subunit alcohol dehydrogenase family)
MKGNKGLRVFEGATVIITGGAPGIGKAFAEELAKRGAELVLADLHVEQAGIIADSIRATGGKTTAVKLD